MVFQKRFLHPFQWTRSILQTARYVPSVQYSAPLTNSSFEQIWSQQLGNTVEEISIRRVDHRRARENNHIVNDVQAREVAVDIKAKPFEGQLPSFDSRVNNTKQKLDKSKGLISLGGLSPLSYMILGGGYRFQIEFLSGWKIKTRARRETR